MTEPPGSDPFDDLIARAQAGSREAYDELFAAAGERLHLYLRLRVGDALRQREESLDLLQETYLAAHREFAGMEPRGERAFVAWLCRIAENCIRARADYHGAARRSPAHELERASRVLDQLRTRSIGPATRAERQDCRRGLAEALLRLPREEREVLLWRHFQGEELASIADRLGTSTSSVRRLLARATLRLGSDLGVAGTEGVRG